MYRIFRLAALMAIGIAVFIQPATAQTNPAEDKPVQAKEPGDERFRVLGDTLVIDLQLGLMWARHDNQGPIGWRGAYHYCRQGPPEILGKYKDWRMPTLRELAGLYSWSQYQEPIETLCGKTIKAPDAFELTCDWVWASEENENTASAFNLRSGYVYEERPMNKTGYRALPVRNIPDGEMEEIKRRLSEKESPQTDQASPPSSTLK